MNVKEIRRKAYGIIAALELLRLSYIPDLADWFSNPFGYVIQLS